MVEATDRDGNIILIDRRDGYSGIQTHINGHAVSAHIQVRDTSSLAFSCLGVVMFLHCTHWLASLCALPSFDFTLYNGCT